MAKMFYTLDETKAALGQTEDQIKQLTREGRLREFRDGPRLMFKADQVDALKSQIRGGGEVEMHDSGLPIGLADTGSGSGTGLNMADSIGSGIASGSGLAGISGSGLGSGLTAGAGSGMMNLKEDTALAADLGLSGTVGGIPSPGRSGTGSGSGVGSGGVGSRQGINVFGDDTHVGADPMAQTAMPSAGSMADLNLEGIGSGSGLLDLTRESDETSLGAELLDEIGPGGAAKASRPLAPPDTGSMAGIKLDAPRGGVVRGGVQQVEAPDAWAPAFGAMSLGVALFLLFAIFALVNAAVGYQPDAVKYFADQGNPFLMIFAIGLVVAGLFFAFGKLIGMSASRR
jgi:uncharacterized integral membrane protein